MTTSQSHPMGVRRGNSTSALKENQASSPTRSTSAGLSGVSQLNLDFPRSQSQVSRFSRPPSIAIKQQANVEPSVVHRSPIGRTVSSPSHRRSSSESAPSSPDFQGGGRLQLSDEDSDSLVPAIGRTRSNESGKRGSRKVTFGHTHSAPAIRQSAVQSSTQLSPTSIAEELLKCQVLKGLSKEQARHLSSKCEHYSALTGQTVMREGDKPEAMYLVRSGFLQVYCNRKVVANKRKGELVGEVAVYGVLWPSLPQHKLGQAPVSCMIPSARTATVVASAQCELIAFPLDVVRDLIICNTALRQNVQDEAVRITLLAALKGSLVAKEATIATPRLPPPVNPEAHRESNKAGKQYDGSPKNPTSFLDSGLQDLFIQDNGSTFLMSESHDTSPALNVFEGMLSLITSVTGLDRGNRETVQDKQNIAIAKKYIEKMDSKTVDPPIFEFQDLAGQAINPSTHHQHLAEGQYAVL